MHRRQYFIFVFICFLLQSVYGNDTVVNRLKSYVRNIETFNKYFPQEKVYLHFDNTGYFRGETIWFKAYVLRDDRSTWTDLSKVLYVELLSPGGGIVDSKKLYLKNGQANSNFKLDSLFYAGFYEVRAYTRYMLNWDEGGIFRRVLPIFASPKKEGDYSNPQMIEHAYQKRIPQQRNHDGTTEKLNVKFYPEGGTLVQGLESNVAFEITGREGKAEDLQGTLVYPDGKTMDVSTKREGRGVFSYTPTSRPATLNVVDRNGRQRSFILPEAHEDGCVLCVNNTNRDRMEVRVMKTSSYRSTPALVLVKSGGVEAFDVVDFDSAGVAIRSFDKQKMSEGVNQLALIDADGRILANRQVFVYPKSREDTVSVSIQNRFLQACKKVSLQIKTLPETTLSVSVRDYDSEVDGIQSDAGTWLLLASDLQGYIRNPEYYLEVNDEEHRRNVDLLMMVQGWRRYELPQMTGSAPFVKRHPVEDGLYVFGQLRQAKRKNGVDHVELRLSLFNQEGCSFSGYTMTDSAGCYAFRIPSCEGDWTLLMNTRKQNKDAKYYVAIDRNISPPVLPLHYYETQQIPWGEPKQKLEELEADFGEIRGEHLLREVKVNGRRRYGSARASWENEQRGAYAAFVRYDCVKEADAIADRGEEVPDWNSWLFSQKVFFAGENSETLEDGLTQTDTPDAGDREGTTFSFSADGPIDGSMENMLNIYTSQDASKEYESSPITCNGRPIVWIFNNQYLFVTGLSRYLSKRLGKATHLSGNSIRQLPTWLDELKSIYVSVGNTWKSFLLFPELEAKHPVTVFLYAPYRYRVKQRGIRRTTFEGYAPTVEFYSPDYSVMAPMPDYRRTLYWNPNVKTDSKGEAKIEFYNNSTCRQLVISAEGITKDGRAMVYRQ